jgi:tRNA (guanine-N7-)-methyltransferase
MMRRASRLSMEELAPYVLKTEMPPKLLSTEYSVLSTQYSVLTSGFLDLPSLFGNANPVEIEVGFGKGLFLVNAGCTRPQTNFLGVEIERKYTLFTATRLAKRGLRNVKVAACEARRFLSTFVGPGSVAAMHVYFPDPWWKNRHRKRRLFTELFAAECARVIAGGGQLHLVSDVPEYFAETTRLLRQFEVLIPLPTPEVKDPEHEMDFLTNFERKYRRQGRPIYRGLWRKNKEG